MQAIKAIIIDNESETIQRIIKFADENVMLIAISGQNDKFETCIDLIKKQKPELIFLDPKDENLQYLQLLNDIDFMVPKFIFMSNDMSKAYQAFKWNAVGFLLKPLNFNDIILSVYKVLKLKGMEQSFQKVQLDEINSINFLNQNKEYIAISSMDKIELVKTTDIIYCKADGKYTEFILANGTKILSTKNLGEYAQTLDSTYFFRIHHSYLINIQHIVKISKKDGYYCEFTNGVMLPVAKRRLDGFSKFIKLS
ncbi:LytR/AlgR family response regulator transcription factor [Arenibacter algicola]|uniref:LytR/AlgR family response regulator transcription factor n=1 Tax=Arenibacter algicola TaxID=616991 RepID=UPI0004DF5B5C|nr:LytTR family DNA-binding domain-containing protein [Arenibacter algicola]